MSQPRTPPPERALMLAVNLLMLVVSLPLLVLGAVAVELWMVRP